MQKGIHPSYYNQVEIICACGSTLITGSVIEGPIRVEICSKCHPFFTGEKKLVDTEGRVERFERQVKKSQDYQAVVPVNLNNNKSKKKEQPNQQVRTLSLRDLLQQARNQG